MAHSTLQRGIASCTRSILTLLALLSVLSQPHADTLKPGYLAFTQLDESRWRLLWNAPQQTGRIETITPLLPQACATPQQVIAGSSGVPAAQVFELRCTAPIAGQQLGIKLQSLAYTEVIARVTWLNSPTRTYRLTQTEPTVVLAGPSSDSPVLFTYGALGYDHILAGYDHILFVLCLVLLLNSHWQILKAVTAFTIAHSITLALSTQGWISIDRSLVEVLIALSSVVLAAEVVERARRTAAPGPRAATGIAFIFGLLHGLGFAAALAEVGIPAGETVTALLGFNLGVEVGQIGIVAVFVGLGWLAAKLLPGKLAKRLAATTASVSGIIGAYWLFERLLG